MSDATRSLPADPVTLPHDPDATRTGEPTSPAAPPDLPPNFALVAEIGRGAMGVVYSAKQLTLNRTVALKMVLAGRHASPTERARFLAEVQSAAAVEHPNVVRVYESGEHAGTPYLAMELVNGGTLAAKHDGQPLPPRQAAEVVAAVARGVQAAHAAGIVHRDLKPGNILLAADGTPKVADFGLAKRPGGSDLTHTGAILGTPGYMAPEQARGQGKAVGPPADVYALGAVLFTCLAGRPPFVGNDPLDVVMKVATEEPPSLRGLVKNVPRDLDTIAAKCLRKDPAARYANAGELADDLQRFVEGKPILARRAGWMERGWRWVWQNRVRVLLATVSSVAIGIWIGRFDLLMKPAKTPSPGGTVVDGTTPAPDAGSVPRAADAKRVANVFLNSVVMSEDPTRLLPYLPVTERLALAWQGRQKAEFSPAEPWYTITEQTLADPVSGGDDLVTFTGRARATARHIDATTRLPTGGTVTFTLTLRRIAGSWLVDGFEFADRGAVVGPAGLDLFEKVEAEKSTLDYPAEAFERESPPAVRRKLGLQSWVFFHTGGPVRFRLTAEEGEGKPRELLAATFDGPEGRVCLQVGRVPDAKTGEPTDAVRVRLNRPTSSDFDPPFLWYSWKGAKFFQSGWDTVDLADGVEREVFQTGAEEEQPPEEKPPRKVLLRLYAKRVEKK